MASGALRSARLRTGGVQRGVEVVGLNAVLNSYNFCIDLRSRFSMRLLWKWLLVSVCGAVLVTVLLFVFAGSWVADVPGPVAFVARIVLWPVAICVNLTGPGPSIGPPEKHWHEATPVQFLAVVVGVGLSWLFYSSLGFLLLWLWRRRHPAAA
jgi:hypothetical protein